MDKQMLYIQIDVLRFILIDLENNLRSKELILEDLRETIEMIKKIIEV